MKTLVPACASGPLAAFLSFFSTLALVVAALVLRPRSEPCRWPPAARRCCSRRRAWPLTRSLHRTLVVERHREAALLTFLTSASGMSLLGIGASFWSLLIGLLAVCLAR